MGGGRVEAATRLSPLETPPPLRSQSYRHRRRRRRARHRLYSRHRPRQGDADRGEQDGRRLSQHRLRPLQGADPHRPPRPRNPHRRLVRSRSEEHTSELPSLMRNSYAGICFKKKNKKNTEKKNKRKKSNNNVKISKDTKHNKH